MVTKNKQHLFYRDKTNNLIHLWWQKDDGHFYHNQWAPSSWVNCGKEHERDCTTPTSETVTMRFGDPENNNYFYYMLDNIPNMTCSTFQGDPRYKAEKFCSYKTDNTLSTVLKLNDRWTKCANDNELCHVEDKPTWIRYGYADKWFIGIQSGTFNCSNDLFGFDPFVGSQKECSFANHVPINNEWVTCAIENTECVFDSNAVNAGTVLRFGRGNKWTYRLATLDRITCSRESFNTDPASGETKVCQYALIPSNTTTTGKWYE